jgi:hypothetical protein
VGPVGSGGGRTTGRLTGPGGRFTGSGCGASRSRRLQDHKEANRSRRREDHREANRSRRQVHREGVWGQ